MFFIIVVCFVWYLTDLSFALYHFAADCTDVYEDSDSDSHQSPSDILASPSKGGTGTATTPQKVKKLKKIKKPIPTLPSTMLDGFMVQHPNLKLWFGYIAERNRVFHKWRARAPRPWTDDGTVFVFLSQGGFRSRMALSSPDCWG
jgi:hypothetical protein